MTTTLTHPSLFSPTSSPKREYPLSKQYPHRHSHYRLNDFFHFQSEKGVITDWNQSRDTLITEDFIIGLLKGLEQEVGEAQSIIMYRIGYEWGMRDAQFFRQWFTQEYGQSNLNKSNLRYILNSWWWPFSAQGWGNWDLDRYEPTNEFLFINIFDSAIARTLGNVGKPVCHIYAGLLAGFLSGLLKKDLSSLEIQCYGTGETYCKFLVGHEERISAASFWQNEGASVDEIIKNIEENAL